MDKYTGVKVLEIGQMGWQEWYQSSTLSLAEDTENYINTGVVLKGSDHKEFGLIKNDKIVKFKYPEAYGIKPKNAEQTLAMGMLLDTDIKLKVITGKEGTGKNIITAACCLHMLLETREYKRLVLTRTVDEVGKSLGLFPGTSDEKFANHTSSFRYTFKSLMGEEESEYIDMLMKRGIIEYLPIQLMRGVSFPAGTLIWADEIAGLSPYELRMLGTRLGEDCALILTGSFEQIDRRVKKEDTGLYKLINDNRIKQSSITSYIELRKNERSALSSLISEVL